MYPIPQKYSVALMFFGSGFYFFFRFTDFQLSTFLFVTGLCFCLFHLFFCFFLFFLCLINRFTDDLFTCICNLEFWSRTSFISSSSCSCSFLLIQAVSVPQIVVALLKRLIQLLRFGQFGCQTLNFVRLISEFLLAISDSRRISSVFPFFQLVCLFF